MKRAQLTREHELSLAWFDYKNAEMRPSTETFLVCSKSR
jgi:hypothetical protein